MADRITVLKENTEVECETLELTIAEARRALDGDLSSDFESALDKLQGDARIQGEAQYLVIIVKP